MSATAQKSFTYRARARDGRLVKGSLDVASESLALARLASMGLMPTRVAEKTTGTGLQMEISFGGGRVTLKALAIATRQLATITQAGVPLLRALTVTAEQTEHATLKRLLTEVARDVEQGKSFSAALGERKQFPLLLVSMVRAGEAGGFLDTSLASIADSYEKEAKLRGTIKSAMTYPMAVLGIAVIAVIGMLLFIVPVFKKMFASLGSQLPLPTQILVTVSNQMGWLLPLIAVLAFGITFWWRTSKEKDSVRRIVHPILLKVPVFGPLIGKVAIARFARNLSNMTAAGVPLLRALTIVGQSSGNWVLEQVAARLADSVRTGASLAGPLAQEKIFPAMVVQMISVGEESGSIDAMLARVADFYEAEIDATAEALTSLIEPMLITVLGVVIGGMVVALYMPIFSLSSALQHAK
ncbi:type II secretion system F family protein [Amnibacterium sp.]|uniref:type II secretion system F family protein n=1 Tax=Amnibacterium sp. TaxID=1872496 RepID=UPI003F7C58DC